MTRLEVLDYAGPTKWRWRLTTSTGEFLADHSVSLDETEWQYEAFTDLYRYLKWNAVPDRRVAHEAELTAQVAEWVRTRVFGGVLAGVRGPVRLEVPPEAEVLAYRPWELAGTTFVIDLPHPSRPKADVGDRLRMLAVFSLPEGAGALNLRKERHALARLVHEIAAVNQKAIELRVLQYGATRERLEEALLEQAGWDVVHLSGHGLPAGLVLEDDTGRRDLITSTELVDLLDEASDQIKLVTLSACESAAVTATEHLQLLGLSPAVRTASESSGSLPAVATEIVRRLDCAVLAMRYPVVDDFAIALTGRFYDLVLGKGRTVASALAVALSKVTSGPPTPAIPALSAATPTLFGARSGDLRLVPPWGGPDELKVDRQKLAEFPEQVERFVGRVGPMTRATTALAPRSGSSGVLFHGMAGAGKTSCAVELAYTHQESFPFMAWHVAPPDGHEIATALAGFVRALERQLPGLKLVHRVGDIDMLREALPNLTEVLENNRVLIILDNVESLLTDKGEWRDERWALLIRALTNHRGFSRLVLTSRRKPMGLRDSVLCEAVHALSLRESVLLAREWPHLRALIDNEPELAVRTLQIVQGHPKLLEFAEGIAADKDSLAERLDLADSTWHIRSTRLDAFIRDGESIASDDDFLAVLGNWTTATVAALPDDAVLLFQMLCCIEEGDRLGEVVAEVWPKLWLQLDRPGDPLDVGELLALLVEHALVVTVGSSYRLHPGIAETGRADVGVEFWGAVDNEMAKWWSEKLFDGLVREHRQQLGSVVRQAALGAAPYLLRQRMWEGLNLAVETAIQRDRSTATAASLLPIISTVAEETRGSDLEFSVNVNLATVLAVVDESQAEKSFRDMLESAVADGKFDDAVLVLGEMADMAIRQGRFKQADDLMVKQFRYLDKAETDSLTRLVNDARRLQVMVAQGRGREALELAEHYLAVVGEKEAEGGYFSAWSAREMLLNVGVLAAGQSEQWQKSIEFNKKLLEFKRMRGASVYEQARASLNDYTSLIGLGRAVDARNLLRWCCETFKANGDYFQLGKGLAALATVECELGNLDRSLQLGLDALRLLYVSDDLAAISVAHGNFALHLLMSESDDMTVWVHMLASYVIQKCAGRVKIDGRSVVAKVAAMGISGQEGSFEWVSRKLEETPGVQFGELLNRLGVTDGQALLDEVFRQAERAALEQSGRSGTVS
ncbi:CHAT domain-containing protein [Actinosynnema sp. ALI-1.44]|uniref:CHAT domain-containing protein n=1 Tax=Actinosynnema sp. ALI-1.44 TaxID=1933779 RepID=UPI00097CABD4|nr:CHAT domain-containing protein [Actinosynnema sp. ALI-1.44]